MLQTISKLKGKNIYSYELTVSMNDAKHSIATHIRHGLKDASVLKESKTMGFYCSNKNWLTKHNVRSYYHLSPSSQLVKLVSLVTSKSCSCWAIYRDVHLLFNPKPPRTFCSPIWNNEHNPDLSFLMKNNSSISLQASLTALRNFPCSHYSAHLLWSSTDWIDIKITLEFLQSKLDCMFHRSWRQNTPYQADPRKLLCSSYQAAVKHIPHGYLETHAPC